MCMYSSWNSWSVKKILIGFILIFFLKKTVVQMLLMLHKKSPSSSTYNSYINDNMENHIDLKRYK